MEKGNNLSRDVYRVLQLFERLNQGEILSKQKLSEEYSVADKTIQRDIRDLKEYFRSIHGTNEDAIEYRRDKKGFILRESLWKYQSKQQVLAMAKVLLESHAFEYEEMKSILESLAFTVAPTERPVIQQLLRNELLHYQQPHQRPMFDLIWQLSESIVHQQVLKLQYSAVANEVISFFAVPAAVLFSDNHFYLIAAPLKQEENTFVPALDESGEPSILRLDRLLEMTALPEQISIPYSRQYEEQRIRTRIQMLHHDERVTVRIRYWGNELPRIAELFPDTQVLSAEADGCCILQLRLPEDAVKPLLFLSLDTLEVLEPTSLRKEMQETASRIVSIYGNMK